MAKQTINIGTAPNDGTGTPLRTAFDYCNLNFTELYTAVGPSGNNIVVPGNATISGDLTVASSILKVTGGNVGINTATPTNTAGYKTLEIVGTGVNTGGMIRMKSSDASVSSYDFVDNNGRGIFAVSNHNLRFGCNDIEQYRIQPLGIFTWYDGAGGTRMTLNSTGLGVGVTPSASWTGGGVIQQLNGAIYSNSSLGSYDVSYNSVRTASNSYVYAASSIAATRLQLRDGAFNFFTAPSGTAGNTITFTQAMTLDASGNLLVGTTSGSFRGQFAVASGADRNVFTAQVTGASNGFQVLWNHATTTTRVIIANIPTSSAGLAAGTLWNDAGTIKIA